MENDEIYYEYTIDTHFLDDFQIEEFKALLEKLEDMGCIVTHK